MCGIAGLIRYGTSNEQLNEHARQMISTISHRGPDADGIWTEVEAGVALAHARLAIIDLSDEASQPMVSASGRFILSFNGEIYNYIDMASELKQSGVTFRSTSDTEVLLEAIEAWGLHETLKRTNGMFAFALYDRKHKSLSLARDRLGIKPLYYGWLDSHFVFASELRPISKVFRSSISLNRSAIPEMISLNYVPAPKSIYNEVYKLTQGTFLNLSTEQCNKKPSDFSADADDSHRAIKPQFYWNARDYAHPSKVALDAKQAEEKLDYLLRNSVSRRMVADVPLGAFLSGGIDSSAVVALMQAQSTRPIRTFSIGFDEQAYNEAPHAKQVAEHLGCDHTELYCSIDEAIQVVPRLACIYDEPFADSSQIPTYLVSELARRHVTVSLSGDGGDEIFSGYPRYPGAKNIWSITRWLPKLLKTPVAATLSGLPLNRLRNWYDIQFQPGQGSKRYFNPFFTLYEIGIVMRCNTLGDVFSLFMQHWVELDSLFAYQTQPPDSISEHQAWAQTNDLWTNMSLVDTLTYLPDDILTKVDRASMAVSLEARVPLLDHRIVEYALGLPSVIKRRNGLGKIPLRNVLNRYVPQELIDRPKMGFGIPIGNWLRGSLRDWAEDLLEEDYIREQGIFDPTYLRGKWNSHIDGREHMQNFLWGVLMFQAWDREQRQ